MKYKISDIAKLTGLSASAIRFYETAGIISPKRSKNEKYRFFDLEDIYILLNYQYYRKIGFTLQESADLVYALTPNALEKNLVEKSNAIIKEIEEKKALLSYLEKQIEYVRLSQEEIPLFKIEKNPAILRIKVFRPGRANRNFAPLSNAKEWLEKMPFVSPCVLFSADDIQNKNGDIEAELGYGIEEPIADLIGFQPKVLSERIPSMLCIHTIVRMSTQMTLDSRQIENVRKFLKENRLSISGSAIGQRLYYLKLSTQEVHMGHLWIPIKKQNNK